MTPTRRSCEGSLSRFSRRDMLKYGGAAFWACPRCSKNYYTYKSLEELAAWNNLFLPISQGA